MSDRQKERGRLLEQLGFTPHLTLEGFFWHPIIEGCFDFTSTSPEGVAYAIFNRGVCFGEASTQRDIRGKFEIFLGSLGGKNDNS